MSAYSQSHASAMSAQSGFQNYQISQPAIRYDFASCYAPQPQGNAWGQPHQQVVPYQNQPTPAAGYTPVSALGREIMDVNYAPGTQRALPSPPLPSPTALPGAIEPYEPPEVHAMRAECQQLHHCMLDERRANILHSADQERTLAHDLNCAIIGHARSMPVLAKRLS